MVRVSLPLSLLAILLAACSAPATPVNVPEPTSAPTMTPIPASPSFIILAYATDGIVADHIPYAQLTHINYSFLTPKSDGTFNPINNGWKLKRIVGTARQHKVFVSISVGGWGWDDQFEEMAAHPESRSAFVQNLEAFVNEYQLDGADIDWEYPDAGQSSQNFLKLIQELRDTLPDKLLTTAVVSYGDDNGLGIPTESFELFDFVNVMTYDGPDHWSMEQFEKGLAYWSRRGLPKEKLVMGIPFYGKPDMPYFQLIQDDPAAAQTDVYEYSGTTFRYNGIPTIQTKTHMAMEKANGIMFWALDYDAQDDLSLVNTIHQTLHARP
jgi:GH18 family chitinase